MGRSFCVLVPAYNEEGILGGNVGRLMNFLESRGLYDYGIIVCDNGSTDGTPVVGGALMAAHPGRVRFIRVEGRGVGLAFRAMVEAADCERLISVDADLSTDLEFIPEAVGLLGECNIVVGSKRLGFQQRRWYRTFISVVFTRLVRLLLGLEYGDYSIGCKGWRKSDIAGLVGGIDHGSSYVIELIYHVVRGGGRVVEVPVYCDDRRPSKFNIVHEVFYRLKNLLTLWLRVRKA
jgi:glycosyltransferase involved in cell wall biosynthesis